MRAAQRVQDAEAMPRRERGTLMSAGMRWRPFDIATGYAGAGLSRGRTPRAAPDRQDACA